MTDQQPTPACQCGHPQERHTLLSGTYAHCRFKYAEAGRGKCFCGMYRPEPTDPKRATLNLDDASNDPHDPTYQVSISAMSGPVSGYGYRLMGPSYIGQSRRLRAVELDQRDADEIRAILDDVFPREVAAPVAAPTTAPPVDTDLRDRIAQAARDLGHPQWDAAALADAVLAVLPAPAEVCICGHTEAQHFEDCCQVCDCGMFLVPEAAREMITHLHAAVLRLRANAPAEFELRSDTEIRAAALREAAGLLAAHAATLEALSSSDYDNEAFAASHLRTKAVDLHRLADKAQPTPAPTARRRLTPNEHDRAWHAVEGSAGEEGADPGTVLNAVLRALRIDPSTADEEQAASPSRRLADEAQQPECTASTSSTCLAEQQSDSPCDTEASECVHGGRPGAEAQQRETEAHPNETEWTVETLWHSGEWRRYWPARATRDEAVEDHERSVTQDPSREFRIVRSTTTTTVEPTPAPSEEPK